MVLEVNRWHVAVGLLESLRKLLEKLFECSAGEFVFNVSKAFVELLNFIETCSIQNVLNI